MSSTDLITSILHQINQYEIFIDETITLAKKYQSFQDLKVRNEFENSQLINEVTNKLVRLKYIIKKIILIHKEIIILSEAIKPMNLKTSPKLEEEFWNYTDQIHIYLDALYYTSFRIFVIFRDKLNPKEKFRADKIRDIRNRLIEHPEVLSQSLGGLMEVCGFKLKIARSTDFKVHKEKEQDIFQDDGVYINFNEFLNNLKSKLENINKQ